jgi:phage gp16-like protein
MRSNASIDDRRADLAAIHIAKKALGWSDDEYRDVLWVVCNVRSSAELDMGGRRRFLAHLQACGWENRRAQPEGAKRKPWTPPQKLIWSLWQQLGDAGLVQHRDRKALEAWVHRHTGVQKVEWLNRQQQQMAIEGLKAWLARAAA